MSSYAQGSRERHNGNKENFNYKIKKPPTPRNQSGLSPCTNLHVLSNTESADTSIARAITHSLLLSQQLCLLGETKNPKQQTNSHCPKTPRRKWSLFGTMFRRFFSHNNGISARQIDPCPFLIFSQQLLLFQHSLACHITSLILQHMGCNTLFFLQGCNAADESIKLIPLEMELPEAHVHIMASMCRIFKASEI